MQITSSSKHIVQKAVALLLILAALYLLGFIVFTNLGELRILDYDEARHGINAYEMIRNDDYIVQTNQGEADYWNLKPPLSFWAITLSYRLFGYNSFALRFHSALAVLLTGIAIAAWFFKRKAYAPAFIAILAILASSSINGDHFARTGDADALYQLFFTLAMLFMLSSTKKFEWLYGSALCFGLAFLCKATHAFLIPAICFFHLLLSGQIKELKPKRILLLLLAGLCLIVPWAIARYMSDGMAFFEGMISTDVAERIGTSAHEIYLDKPTIVYYYHMVLKTPIIMICTISSAIMLLTLLLAKVKIANRRISELIGCVLWAVLPVILYSIANVRFVWYINSVHLALPVLTGLLLLTLIETNTLKRWAALYSVILMVLLGIHTYQNAMTSVNSTFDHSLQSFLRSLYIRDYDADTHVFIDYGTGDERNDEYAGNWMPADILTSYFYGDVVCVNGGMEAFDESDEFAMMIMVRSGNEDIIDETAGYYTLRDENYYYIALSNY